ncbi:hypothetical protein ILUMI_10093 [Ignelater luminosus]|uniref:Uncharacterized protein n=1 Tax=Ignelater luminosus TaxID=2038154 RepID=A0A8K0D4J5_IGNLU|nr:hypothetical protein ILUMI_10093 [Ignelater luminosus]
MSTITKPLRFQTMVNFIPTDILYYNFENDHAVIARQISGYPVCGKIFIAKDNKMADTAAAGRRTFTYKPVRGNETFLRIAEIFTANLNIDKPLFFSLLLMDYEAPTVMDLLDILGNISDTL